LVRVIVCATLVVPVVCDAKVRLVRDSVGAGTVPLPVKVIDSGESAALSVNTNVAVLVPAALGANTTLMVQVAPAATLDKQVFVWLKSTAFVPVMATLAKISGTCPVFVTVTDCVVDALPTRLDPKPTLVVLLDTTGVPAVPVSATVCGELPALLTMVSVPVLVPAAVGVNVTEIVQLAPAARSWPLMQVVIGETMVKSPLTLRVETRSARLPVFDNVTVWAALVVATG